MRKIRSETENLLASPGKTKRGMNREESTTKSILAFPQNNQGNVEQTRSASRIFFVPAPIPDLVETKNREMEKLSVFPTDEYGSATPVALPTDIAQMRIGKDSCWKCPKTFPGIIWSIYLMT